MDNFDADINSPNGKLSTYSLAMMLMQPSNKSDSDLYESILHLTSDETKRPLDPDEADVTTNKATVFRKIRQCHKSPSFVYTMILSQGREFLSFYTYNQYNYVLVFHLAWYHDSKDLYSTINTT